ncbi:MAG: heme NO-binding domain-containing protein [Paracoccaceae bacterium]|nr:heme NO-binding domain-containing protein [Paracoccaceae bacterium]
MHGLINRSIQSFLRDTYGTSLWTRTVLEARLGFDNFEAMLVYEDAITGAVLDAAARQLRRPREALLEDLGTYLVSHPHFEPLRRLLRFGGSAFVDFLHSLDELPGRARLAVPDLDIPRFQLRPDGANRFRLDCHDGRPGYGHVMVGILRAMADDYGALVVLEHLGGQDGAEVIGIELLAADYAQGRPFALSTAGRPA